MSAVAKRFGQERMQVGYAFIVENRNQNLSSNDFSIRSVSPTTVALS